VSDVEGEVVGDRILLRRDAEAKRPLVQRLNRIEGQIRGLRSMIEEDRYCLDEIQQISALTAALREVALMIISEHVTAGVHIAAEGGADKETALADMIRVLRAGMQYKG
jgi:DNA-binding FrmR family transcriptional regulator